MTTLLLRTKLHIPPPRPERVPRPHLIDRLNAGRHRQLTLISAPAGFSKTTLLSDWVGQFGHPAAWLSLDEEDNESARFWTHLIAAFQTVHPDLGQDTLRLLEAPQLPPARVLLSPLLNEITTLPTESVNLVLDDYHLITTPQMHEGITFLLEHPPSHFHLLISTRADLPTNCER
jgi:LuxR family maltose regulon positive regulatory protein